MTEIEENPLAAPAAPVQIALYARLARRENA